VEAVLVEGRSVREVARAHGVSKTWSYELLARYRVEGEAGLVARSKRPRRSPTRVPETVEDEIVAIRKHLVEFGVEAGPDTIHTHLTHTHDGIAPCSVSSVWRILTRRGFITPEPHKRPRSSYIRFEAALPNECWQTDMTHVLVKNGRSVEVLNVIDDYSRLCVASRAFPVTTAADVVTVFYETAQQYGFPASILSDNGAIFTASFRGDRGALATELAQRGIVFKHSRPYHPQTCGKVERFHQTMKKYLAANPTARALPQLQIQLDTFATYYNDIRPHRAKHRTTPNAAYNARVKAKPAGTPIRDAGEFRIRRDRVDQSGKVTLRYAGRLRHLAVGRAHKGQHVLMLVNDRDVRVLTTDGKHLAEHRIDPDRTYQPRR
jgi:transposase InsO family protein